MMKVLFVAFLLLGSADTGTHNFKNYLLFSGFCTGVGEEADFITN